MDRLIVDVTRTLESGLHTGIQRVVRRLHAGLTCEAPARGWHVVPVIFEGEQWQALEYLPPHPFELGPVTTRPPGQAPARYPFKPCSGDVILLADASWYLNPWPAVDAALARGARLSGMVHDLLPVRRPEWFQPSLAPVFHAHLNRLIERAAQIFVPSHHVLEQLTAYIEASGLDAFDDGPPEIVRLPHGADLSPEAPIVLSERSGHDVATPASADLFIAVGTIEPRKNQGLILDAFERLWANGGEQHLLLIGAAGWRVDGLLARLAAHPQRGRRLFHPESVTDSQLVGLYRQARALLYLSRDEGFGLPIVEASYHGCPVIATDIAPLREAGGDWPTYLPPNDVDALVEALSNVPAGTNARPCRTWRQVAVELLAVLSAGVFQRSLPAPG